MIHLHGVADGKDHLSLARGNEADLLTIFRILKERDYQNVLTLEIFSETDLKQSLEVVEQLWHHPNEN